LAFATDVASDTQGAQSQHHDYAIELNVPIQQTKDVSLAILCHEKTSAESHAAHPVQSQARVPSQVKPLATLPQATLARPRQMSALDPLGHTATCAYAALL
jgi:hypothetical protein